MKQDVVLPKFKIPGQTNWLIRGLWIAGGLVAIQLVAVAGFFLWKRSSEEAVQAAATAARTQALAEAQQQAAAAPKPATPPAKSAAKSMSGSTMPASTTMAAAPGSRVGAGAGVGAKRPATLRGAGKGGVVKRGKLGRAGSRYALRRRSAARGKSFARSAPARAGAPKAKAAGGKSDAIDDILRKFK